MFTDCDNPYQTPIDDCPAKYDRTWLKRFLYACSVLAIFYLSISAWSSVRYFQRFATTQDKPVLEQVHDFFFDWKQGGD